ncbi:MAG: NAD(P)H-binding protein [Bacteroidota bacterium]
MQKPHSALLIGATGLCGQQLLSQLLESELYQTVEIWVRKPTGITHPKLTERTVDFSHIDTINCVGIHHVFCALGTTIKQAKTQQMFYTIDHDYVLACGRAAEKMQADMFLYISSMGANKRSGNFYLRTKGMVEDSLSTLSIPSIVLFRPSMLLGKRKEFRLGEKIGNGIMKAIGFMMIGSLKKYRGIQATTVARAMLYAAQQDVKGTSIFESDIMQQMGKND